MNPREFIESAPLYTRIGLVGFSPPDSITRMCTNAKCRRETTWSQDTQVRIDITETHPDIRFRIAAYSCVLCSQNCVAIIYELLSWTESFKGSNQWRYTAVRKIGQVPEQAIDVPSELNDRLGSAAGHYKKALICREQNYGIGAMAYLRRVVDEKTDELIDVMVELSRTYNVDDGDVARSLGAKSEIRYDSKLQVAVDLIPDALRPGV
jgi:hypothetical protein